MESYKPTCKCPIKEGMPYEELYALLPYNCTSPLYLCPKFDRMLVRAKKEMDLKNAYARRRQKATT